MAAAAATLTACGGAATAAVSQPASQTPARAAATDVPPSPTAAPLPPLAILTDDTAAITAVDAGGHVQWTLTRPALDRLLPATSTEDNIRVQAAGSNVIVTRTDTLGTALDHLVVIDRHGNRIGGGTFTRSGATEFPMVSPTGTEWAWSVQDATSPSVRGRILVAGIGEAAHSVYSWVAPVNATERVGAWTDMGIVMERLTFSGCGVGYHPDTASFLVDPDTGTLSDLFSGESYGDAHHQVRAAFSSTSESAVTVNGTTFDEPRSVAQRLQVSPDGATVAVQRYALVGCGGAPEPTLNTELINVAAGTHTDITGCGFNGWFDSHDFVCSAISSNALQLETVGGQRVATLGTGAFVGVVSG